MKPVREFSGNIGEASTGLGGPDQIEKDLDKLMTMMDPTKTHVGGESGGLKAENFNAGVGDDTFIGTRTVDDDIATATADTGTLTQLFSWIAKLVKGITGKADWKTAPAKTLETLASETTTLIADLNTEEAALVTHKDSADHDERYTPTASLTKGLVGLGNVDNTSDSAKPVSIAQAEALALKVDDTEFATHKTSGDHNGQYISKTETVEFTPTHRAHPATFGAVVDAIAGVIGGIMPDLSVTDAKLATDVKVGSLAALSALLNGYKTSVVVALNKVVAWLGDLTTLSTTERGSFVGAINEIFAAMATKTGIETLTNKTLAGFKVTTSSALKDAGDNELLRFPAMVSGAVNEVTLKNAATGQAPGFAATGDDAAIDFNVETKGSGVLKVNGEHYLKGQAQTPTITFGQNLVTNAHIADAYPDITFQGQSYVNMLGADGNCEDVSKWATNLTTTALDTTKKVFGANAIKMTLTSTSGNINKPFSSISSIDVTKYYMFSAYLDKGSATNVALFKDNTGGGVSKNVISTDVTPTRKAIKVQPSDMNAGNYVLIQVNGTSTQYAYVDGVQINEITATEYANDSVDVLMARYPYIDSYACLQNPAVEVIHDNMVRNGNGEEGVAWWTPGTAVTSFTKEVSGFKLVTSASDFVYQTLKVLPNTDYYIKANKSGASSSVRIITPDFQTSMIIVDGTFNSGSNTSVLVVMRNTSAGTGYFDSIHLIPGTVAPTAYKPQRREQCVIEGKFATGDTVRLKDGKLEGTIGWEHKTLYGRDWAWEYFGDASGYKNVRFLSPVGVSSGVIGDKGTKYDGKMLLEILAFTAGDQFYIHPNGYTYVSIADTDTGWAEAIAPNADEVKAYMNGWKANANNGTRYTSWVSVVDGSAPATNTIAYVSANVAPLYKGYQLHYQLANPKAVNEYNTRLKGVLPKLENGINVVNVDAGLVIGEVASPYNDGSYANINDNRSAYSSDRLNRYVERFLSIYRNRVFDMSVWVIDSLLSAPGNYRAYAPIANFDPKAQYTVDYTILRTQAPVVGTPSMEYTPGVTEKIQPIMNQPAQFILPGTGAPSNDFGFDGDICFVYNPSV